MQVIKAPNPVKLPSLEHVKVFLAGSIEMGKALPWQDKIAAQFTKEDKVIFANPRRDDWDNSWEQKEDNPMFKEQVTWELNQLLGSDIAFFYFQPGTVSPISLLELGLVLNAQQMKVIVCCPNGFHRKGNVDITCNMFDTFVHSDLSSAVWELKETVKVFSEY